MDWITGISKAIDYIEEHITEPTDYARAATSHVRRRLIFSACSLCCAVIRSADVQNPDYTCEIWIAVKPKK